MCRREKNTFVKETKGNLGEAYLQHVSTQQVANRSGAHLHGYASRHQDSSIGGLGKKSNITIKRQ
jgi:hypothetical protein